MTPEKEAEILEEPKDLKLKMGTKKEVLWTEVLRQSKVKLEQAQDDVIIQGAVIHLAEMEIKKEKARFAKENPATT